MRNVLLATVLAMAPVAALAQPQPPQYYVVPPAQPQAPVPMSPVNCDALNQGTLICVRNGTGRPITKITCSGSIMGAIDLSIPHGIIASGETTIVDFAKSRCTKHIVVFTRDGRQYPCDGFDTTSNTSLLVDNQ